MRPLWKTAATTLFILTVLVGGLFGDRLLAFNQDARATLRVYAELLTAAHEHYGGDVNYQDMVNASIEGVVRTLDPHTSFLSADAYSNMRERQQTSFFGLGILVGLRNSQITVITPIEGTPASRMGLRAGDIITHIENESTEGMNINDAVRQLKGPKGSKVHITLARPGMDDPIEVTIERDEIPQISVRYAYMIEDKTGYISIDDFNRGTANEVRQAVEKLRDQGMERLLVDLRRNGGGLLDQAIEVVEQFVPERVKVVETRGRTRDSKQDYYATYEGPKVDIPLVVLVGEGTASAAEIFAGAIQDHDVGLIAGTQTWGKGLVQTVYSLSYGNGLALTTAKYFTPSGRLIQRDYTSWFDYNTHSNGFVPPSNGDDTLSTQNQSPEAFLTDLGRKVYGGGGITPDVALEPEELSSSISHLLSRNAFFDFAVEYANRNPIESRDWKPPTDISDRFGQWLLEEDLIELLEWEEIQSDPSVVEDIHLRLHAELISATFGIESRYEILATGDSQIRRALELFDDAGSLLARRHALEPGAGMLPADTGSL